MCHTRRNATHGWKKKTHSVVLCIVKRKDLSVNKEDVQVWENLCFSKLCSAWYIIDWGHRWSNVDGLMQSHGRTGFDLISRQEGTGFNGVQARER